LIQVSRRCGGTFGGLTCGLFGGFGNGTGLASVFEGLGVRGWVGKCRGCIDGLDW
jgi:hypothetical protein